MTPEIKYKLRTFGVPLYGEVNMYCDNEAMYKNEKILESMLSKKHHSVAYHAYRDAVS